MSSPSPPPPATTSLFPHTAAAWPLLDKYFQSPNARYRLTQHHLQSYSDFVRYKIPTVLQDFNSWQHSEVFRGRDFARADAIDKAAGTEHDAQMNAAARAHFFVGMHPLDVHAMSRDGTDLSHPDYRPKRVQVRHQVLEYTQEADTPRRWVTPNEARLRNLNYQLDVTVDVVVVQDSALNDAHNAQSRDAYVRGAMDAWHRLYSSVYATLKGGGGGGGNVTLAARAAKVKGPTQGRAEGTGMNARKYTTADEWLHVVQQAVSIAEGRHADSDDAIQYVAQRLATALAPNVTWEEGIGLTKLPLMLHSDFCVLRDQPDAFLREVGECTYEKGGYFVIRGKEKVIISQEDYQRNIIQTRAITREAPPSFVPASTLVLQRGSGNGVGDKKVAGDTLGQEEDFEASIRCDDDPRPPVVVKLTLKRQAAYYGSASGFGGADSADNPFDFKGPEIDRMHKFLPFKGLYVTLDSRKGPENPILIDIPLFTFFRAMGPTSGSGALNAAAAGHHQRDQLSDREIIEAILGYDLSSTERASVATDTLRAMLGIDDTPKPGETVWYHPNSDADTFWCTCTGKDTPVGLTPDTRVTILLTRRRRTVVVARKKGGQVSTHPNPAQDRGLRTVKTSTQKTVCEAVVMRTAGRGHYQLRLSSTNSIVHAPDITDVPQPSKLKVGGREHACVVCPHRYIRRHRATVLHATKTVLTVEYTTHTARDRAHDPILYDLLRPSILEGNFAPTVAVARDMLERSFLYNSSKTHETLKMQDEELQGLGPRATATDRREAVFRTLFTHIKPDTNIKNLRERRRSLLRRKQLYLGYMVRRLLFAYMGMDERETSRDSYRMRRVKLSGEMLAEVFRYEYFQLQNKYKEYIKQGMRQQGPKGTFDNLLLRSVLTTNLFDSMYMTERLQKSFMGNWGGKIAENAEDQKAYCQELIRLSFLGSIAYLRRVHKELPSTSKPGQKKGTSKAVGPRLLHASQYGMICPLETPDGGNIGKIKHLTMFAFVCPEMPHADREAVRAFVSAHALPVERVARFADLVHYHKILLDGAWTHVVPVAGYTPQLEPGDADVSTVVLQPDTFVDALRLYRRNGLLTPLLSVSWDIKRQEIVLSTQEGRVMRPLLIVEGANALALSRAHHLDPAVTWEALLVGPSKGGASATYHELTYRHTLATKLPSKLATGTASFVDQCQALRATAGVIEYLDTAEIDTRMIAMQPQQLTNREWLMKTLFSHKGLVAHLETEGALVYADAAHPSPDTARLLSTAPLQAWVRAQRKTPSAQAKAQRDAVPYARRIEYDLALACKVPYEPPMDADQQPLAGRGTRTTFTHAELHPALMLGTMGMLIPYPEHSQAPRNQYSCHQSKQGLGTYVSNFRKRMDHANHVLHYPQRSLASSRFLHYINRERLNYGTNVLVAIMCYGGYNIEDAILFNKQSVARGMFHSSYYFTEEVTEKGGTSGSARESVVIGRHPDVPRATTGCQYDKLDTDTQQRGVLSDAYLDKPVAENDVLIEAYEEKREGADQRSFTDYRRVASKAAVVDQVFLSDGQVGRRVGKVTLRTIRVPTIGDKFASRCGQKGTLGALVDEEDMPYVGEGPDSAFLAGARPDLILNPHAIPSRMTVGQLMESLSNVLGCKLGCFTDSTPLCSTQTMGATSNPAEKVSTILGALGLHQHGNVRMCNGTTGERLHGEVFFGPTYYQRLKQMPVDKYYWRREGRADMITRQPIGGRAQGGALKLGEMERDSLLAHGISSFTKEAFFEKSDHFQYRVSTARGTVDPPEVEGKVDPREYVPVRTSMAALHEDGGFRQYLSTQTENPTDYKAHADICDPRERRRTNVETATVNVPFATRLFSQECEAMGVGMRLVAGGEVRVRR